MSQEPSIKKIFCSQFFVVIVVVFLGFVSFAIVGKFQKWQKEEVKARKVRREIALLKEEKIRFAEINQILEKKEFSEREARGSLNLKKPGEKVLVVSKEALAQIRKDVEVREKEEETNPEKWFHQFFN